jgi:hypothetical protein
MKEGRRRTTRVPSLCRKETHLRASTQLTSKLVVVATTDWQQCFIGQFCEVAKVAMIHRKI